MNSTTKHQFEKIIFFIERFNEHGHLYKVKFNNEIKNGYIMGWQRGSLDVDDIYYRNVKFDLSFLPEEHCENFCKEQIELQNIQKNSEIDAPKGNYLEIIDGDKIEDIKDLGYTENHRKIRHWVCC